MAVEIITKDDLAMFRLQLLDDFKQLLSRSDPPKKWIRSSEVRRLLNISAGTLQNMRVNGTLQGKQLPNSRIWYYDAEQIDILLTDT